MMDAALVNALIKFMHERLDEIEDQARSHLNQYVDGEWKRIICDPAIGAFGGQAPARDVATGLYVADMSDPKRVIRDVETKRRIVDDYQIVVRAVRCGPYDKILYARQDTLESCVRELAKVFDEHPGYPFSRLITGSHPRRQDATMPLHD